MAISTAFPANSFWQSKNLFQNQPNPTPWGFIPDDVMVAGADAAIIMTNSHPLQEIPMIEVTEVSIAELRAALESGRTTAVELVEAYQARIKSL